MPADVAELTFFGAGLFTSGAAGRGTIAAGRRRDPAPAAGGRGTRCRCRGRPASWSVGDRGATSVRITALDAASARHRPSVAGRDPHRRHRRHRADRVQRSRTTVAPMLRTLLRLAPDPHRPRLAIVVGATIHAAAIRGAAGRTRTLRALAAAPALLRRSGLRRGSSRPVALPAIAARLRGRRGRAAPGAVGADRGAAGAGRDRRRGRAAAGRLRGDLALPRPRRAARSTRTGSVVWTRVIGMPVHRRSAGLESAWRRRARP